MPAGQVPRQAASTATAWLPLVRAFGEPVVTPVALTTKRVWKSPVTTPSVVTLAPSARSQT